MPWKFAKALPKTDELIHRPGARRLRKCALFEKDDTLSTMLPPLPSSVDPTLTAVEIHPGLEILT